MKIKVLIADDHQLFREGLCNLLSESEEIEIVAQAQNGKDAVTLVGRFNPDIVLMDIGMPVMNGVEATRLLHKKFPAIKVIALSMHTDKHFVKEILEAGAFGYLFKDCNYQQLMEAITNVNSGKKYLSETITQVLIQDYLNKESIKSPNPELSERESEILKLFAEGKSNREIADLLYISIKTVGSHKQNLLEKLDLKTTTDLVKYAIKKGIIILD
jgi:DNA-binding NarL/FixJ family response regulator